MHTAVYPGGEHEGMYFWYPSCTGQTECRYWTVQTYNRQTHMCPGLKDRHGSLQLWAAFHLPSGTTPADVLARHDLGWASFHCKGKFNNVIHFKGLLDPPCPSSEIITIIKKSLRNYLCSIIIKQKLYNTNWSVDQTQSKLQTKAIKVITLLC